ncbi:MAG: hypothetical protein NVS1B3_03180 [Candidatus Dormibacteraceae bacterium]
MLDMEASLEHMRRGTVRHVDTMLIVTEPYFRSLETAARLAELGREIGIQRVAAIANKVRTAEEETAVRDFCERHGIELAQVIHFDTEVTRVDNAGLSLLDMAPRSRAADSIRQLAISLEEVA